ncbi:MAG: GNAT family N-acetyltransferase [Bacteroidales bacterium]
MSILKGKNITLRALEPSDVEMLYEWENNSSIWNVSNTLIPFSRFTIEKFIADSHIDIFQARQLRLMIEHTGIVPSKTIGAIDLFDYEPIHKRAGVGILINDEINRKRGFASEALELLINYSFSVLQMHQLYCNIDCDNKASIKLFEKCEFRITGEKKEWIRTPEGWKNEYFLQLINQQY